MKNKETKYSLYNKNKYRKNILIGGLIYLIMISLIGVGFSSWAINNTNSDIIKDIDINIPKGINNGQQIRVPGKGARGENGGENGDLYIEVMVQPHDQFQRDGNDIHLNVPIDFVDVCLGTKIVVPTISGECEVEIPAGTQPNAILRLKGKGVKDLRSDRYGDEFIHLNVKTPTKLTKEQKDLLVKFKSLSGNNENWFDKFKKAFKK